MLYKVVATAEKACLPRPIIYRFSAIYNGASWNDWKRWSIVLAGHCLKLYFLFFRFQSDIKYCCHCSFCDCVSWAWFWYIKKFHAQRAIVTLFTWNQCKITMTPEVAWISLKFLAIIIGQQLSSFCSMLCRTTDPFLTQRAFWSFYIIFLFMLFLLLFLSLSVFLFKGWPYPGIGIGLSPRAQRKEISVRMPHRHQEGHMSSSAPSNLSNSTLI